MNETYLYDSGYFRQYEHDRKRETMYSQEHARILEYYPQGATILDYGCGTGGFLANFDDRWIKYGVEPSVFAAKKSRVRKINITMTENLMDECMDVIVFRGTLQHIHEPMQALTEAARLLKRGGMLFILSTPDTDSLVYKIWGRLPPLDAPRNWVLFGRRYTVNILTRLGLETVKELHPYFGTPYAAPLKDFMKFIISLFFGWRPFAFPGNMMEIHARKA